MLLPRQPDWAGLVFWGSELLHEIINHTSCYVLSGHSPEISDHIVDFPQGDTPLTCMGSYPGPNPHNGFLTSKEKVLKVGYTTLQNMARKAVSAQGQTTTAAGIITEWSHWCNIIKGMAKLYPRAGPLSKNTIHIDTKKKKLLR